MNSVESRRKFLKKAAYVAPAVLALGTLTAPSSAHASVISVSKDVKGPFGQLNVNTTGHYDNQKHVFTDMNSKTTIVKTGKEIASHDYTQKELSSNLLTKLWRSFFNV
jgi:hypothetical protein